MKTRLFSLSVAVFLLSTFSWAQTVVSTDAEIRAAIQVNNANIQLGADINLSNSTLSIPSDNTVTINLNGHKLDRKLTKRGQGGGTVITVRSGATLHISNGTITGGWGGAGGALSNENGTVFLTDVIITDNVADDRGGGICNREGGTLTMTGGAITNNISQDKTAPEGGGGLFNAQNATATLTNVTITGNKAQIKGGGGICNYGTMTLDGCTVTGNTCQLNGGGIWTAANATLKMKGANTVTGNKSADRSGGVNSDLFLKTNALITVTGSLAGSAIGIDMESEFGVFTSGYNTHNSGVDPATIFLPMVSDVMAISLDGNEAKLASSLAEGEYYYIDHWWDPDNKKIVYLTKVVHPGEYTILKGSHDDTDLFLAGTYVVKGNCYYDGIAYASANTKIILCDGAKLEIEGNLEVTNSEVYLDIYGQARNNGVLQSNANITHTGYGLPGIGSNMDTHSFLAFHGGVIKTKGETSRAGISGGVDDLHSEVKFFDAVVEARGGADAPGIGLWDAANKYYQKLSVKIYGGVIKAWGGKNAAGIGGGYEGPGVNVEVYGGEVYAWGGDDGAGIGGGWNGSGEQLIVYGGLVKAWGGGNGAGIGSGSEASHVRSGEQIYGGGVTIYGGEVYAYGGVDAAGIGGGEDATGAYTIIYGGYVYAEGQDEGAGIGGGQDGEGNYLEIHGGTVIAKAGCDDTGCRAIGPGTGCDDYGDLVVGDNMMVTSERKATNPERKNMCWYRTQVRVEVCDHSDGFTYTIDGTGPNDHHISHCAYCNHTDTAVHTFVNGKCTVCGVEATAYAAKLYMPVAQATGSFDGQTYSKNATHLVVPDSAFRLPMATLKVPGYEFIGWEATTEPTEDSYISPYTTATADTLYRAGNKYKVTGNICFVARYRVADVTLYDDEPNGETLNEYNGMKVNKVILSGRVFNKNNTWQPLSLPFSLSADELAASPLAGCTLKELDTDSSYNDTENKLVYLYFKDTTAIAAGKPYIIRWTEGNPILSPEFTNVTLTNKTADAKARLLMYKSIYSPQTFTSANKTVLYFNDNGVLVHPNGESPVTVGAFRAYFRLTNLMGGDPDADFTITSNIDLPQGIDQTPFPSGEGRGEAYKVIRNGMLFIERNGNTYNAQGARVK